MKSHNKTQLVTAFALMSSFVISSSTASECETLNTEIDRGIFDNFVDILFSNFDRTRSLPPAETHIRGDSIDSQYLNGMGDGSYRKIGHITVSGCLPAKVSDDFRTEKVFQPLQSRTTRTLTSLPDYGVVHGIDKQ